LPSYRAPVSRALRIIASQGLCADG
jgi:hypothetical protein